MLSRKGRLQAWSLRLMALVVSTTGLCAADLCMPRAERELVFAEQEGVGGVVAVEVEHFFAQAFAEHGAFHLTSPTATPDLQPDGSTRGRAASS